MDKLGLVLFKDIWKIINEFCPKIYDQIIQPQNKHDLMKTT